MHPAQRSTIIIGQLAMRENEEIEPLLAAMLDGALNQEQASVLTQAMKDDSAMLQRFGSLVTIDRLLTARLGRDAGDHFAPSVISRINFQQEDGSREAFVSWVITKLKRERAKRVTLWAGGLAAAVIVIFFSLSFFFEKIPVEDSSRVVAQIVSKETSDQRANRNSGLKIGERIEIENGLLELAFSTGVNLVLNGPVDFEITGLNSGYLHHGRVVVEVVNEQGKGFTVDGPNGRLIDLGTKFGVSVDVEGEMEVHVIEGIVDALPKVGEKTRLRANEAMRLTGNHAKQLNSADESAFFTQMPPNASSPPNFVHWGFDEEDGQVCFDTGHQLGGGNAEAKFKTPSQGGSLPERIPGRFSNAIHLGGSGYLYSDFRGIAGRGPRTVAFWVKVPTDFHEKEGFGIVSWGSYAKQGSAWQVAINSFAKEGPMGRLRIGTNGGEVIGETDLRDGEWHHCAVVLYGDKDEKPNTATHILLYVDGRIESATRKSVLPVDTVLKNNGNRSPRGVWIGRNMGNTTNFSFNGPYGRFFRGYIDELIICDTALSFAEINLLKNENKMPTLNE